MPAAGVAKQRKGGSRVQHVHEIEPRSHLHAGKHGQGSDNGLCRLVQGHRRGGKSIHAGRMWARVSSVDADRQVLVRAVQVRAHPRFARTALHKLLRDHAAVVTADAEPPNEGRRDRRRAPANERSPGPVKRSENR